MNGDLLNLLGMHARSISSENDDGATLRSAQLMASIASLRCLRRSGEVDILSAKSHDLSLDLRESLW